MKNLLDETGDLKFEDVSRVASVSNLKHSFSCMFFDYNNDGLQDLWDYRILQDVQNPKEFHTKYVPDDICVFSNEPNCVMFMMIDSQSPAWP